MASSTSSPISGCLKLGAILAMLGAILFGAVFSYLSSSPAASEAVIRQIVTMAGIPTDIFGTIEVVDDSAWFDILSKGNLGMAEAYMHGKVNMQPLDFFKMLLNGTSIGTRRNEGSDALQVLAQVLALPTDLKAMLFNQQTLDKSRRVTEQHYDAGNDLYEVMLGPTMSYTCAYWSTGAQTLDEAQVAKFDLVRRKLQLEDGMKVVDLGMGWGTAAKHVFEHTPGSQVTGVSLSKEQVTWAQDNLATEGLTFIWSDYRDHCADPKYRGTYDRVYSIGMLEHVGWQNYRNFFECVKELLKPDGLAVIHTIGEPDFVPAMDPFLDTYIFPGAVIPSTGRLLPAMEKNFILEDFQNFGFDYSLTLAAWSVNSKKFFAEHPGRYTPEFQRMWEYYLTMCEALFDLRLNQLWHFVLSPRPATRKRIERQI